MSQIGSITAEKEKQMALERQKFQPKCWRSKNIKEQPEPSDISH